MYNIINETNLLLPDIAQRLGDYVGIQPDVDETRVKAASLVAQDLDLKPSMKTSNKIDNWSRCFEDGSNYSEALYDLVVPALCFFTYARLVTMFQANYTDSGTSVEEGSLTINEARSVSKQYRAIGESYLGEIIEFLKEESSDTEATMDTSVRRVRGFGGNEIYGPGSGQTFDIPPFGKDTFY